MGWFNHQLVSKKPQDNMVTKKHKNSASFLLCKKGLLLVRKKKGHVLEKINLQVHKTPSPVDVSDNERSSS